jgi:hypothetical protein
MRIRQSSISSEAADPAYGSIVSELSVALYAHVAERELAGAPEFYL